MQHALSILTVSAERAENDAIHREQTADACAKDGEFERAENLRAQAVIERRIANDCREAISKLQDECGHLGTCVTALTKIIDECDGGEVGDPEIDLLLARINDIAVDAIEAVQPS